MFLTATDGVNATKETTHRSRKEKTPFTIDFVTPDENVDDPDILFATSNASINMPKTQRKSKGRREGRTGKRRLIFPLFFAFFLCAFAALRETAFVL